MTIFPVSDIMFLSSGREIHFCQWNVAKFSPVYHHHIQRPLTFRQSDQALSAHFCRFCALKYILELRERQTHGLGVFKKSKHGLGLDGLGTLMFSFSTGFPSRTKSEMSSVLTAPGHRLTAATPCFFSSTAMSAASLSHWEQTAAI